VQNNDEGEAEAEIQIQEQEQENIGTSTLGTSGLGSSPFGLLGDVAEKEMATTAASTTAAVTQQLTQGEIVANQAAASAVVDEAVGVTSSTAGTAQSGVTGGLNLYKFGSSTSTASSGWSDGSYFLNLPDQGNAQNNWQQNSSALRAVMSEGNPIYDSYINPSTGQQIPTSGFLNAERNLLENQGWTYNPTTGAYNPPTN